MDVGPVLCRQRVAPGGYHHESLATISRKFSCQSAFLLLKISASSNETQALNAPHLRSGMPHFVLFFATKTKQSQSKEKDAKYNVPTAKSVGIFLLTGKLVLKQ